MWSDFIGTNAYVGLVPQDHYVIYPIASQTGPTVQIKN